MIAGAVVTSTGGGGAATDGSCLTFAFEPPHEMANTTTAPSKTARIKAFKLLGANMRCTFVLITLCLRWVRTLLRWFSRNPLKQDGSKILRGCLIRKIEQAPLGIPKIIVEGVVNDHADK